MKKFLVAASLVLASISGFAQNEVGTISVTPKVGINASNMTTFVKSDYRIGFTLGAEAAYQLCPDFSVSAAAMYSQEGCKSNWLWSDGTVKLDYISIPMMANYYWDHGITLKVGLQPSVTLSAKGTVNVAGNSTEGNLSNKPMDAEGHVINVQSVYVALPVGISYESSKHFVFDLRYNIGITEAIKFNAQRSTNFVFQFTVGYKLPL